MLNRYRDVCSTCGLIVAEYCGTLKKDGGKWTCSHINCDQVDVDVITFSSGAAVTQNVNGRCIDAPCCGCCTV